MIDQGGPDGEWLIEAHAAGAWPAASALPVDGWLLRHTPGVLRRRSNSVLPPLRPSLDQSPAGDSGRSAGLPERVIAMAEEYYAGLGLPAVVQVTPAARRGDLDALLAGRGYARAAPTLVLTAPAAQVAGGVAAGGASAAGDRPGPVEVTDHPDPEWSRAFADLDDHQDSALVADAVIGRIALPAGYARLRLGAEIAGVGLFVGGGRYTGAFCIATAPGYRRRGWHRRSWPRAPGGPPSAAARSCTCRWTRATRRPGACMTGSDSPPRTATTSGSRRGRLADHGDGTRRMEL